jgi:hypothetical protein
MSGSSLKGLYLTILDYILWKVFSYHFEKRMRQIDIVETRFMSHSVAGVPPVVGRGVASFTKDVLQSLIELV